MKEHGLLFPREGATEKLLMTPLGGNLYRLEESSLAEVGAFYHDVVEAKSRLGRDLRFSRVVERSGLRVFRFLLSQELAASEPFAAFLRRVEAHGGFWEQVFGGIVLIHLPRGSACRPKSELRALLRTLEATP